MGLAAAELAAALVAESIAVTADDKVIFQELLDKIELSPDTPVDIADRLVVKSSSAVGTPGKTSM